MNKIHYALAMKRLFRKGFFMDTDDYNKYSAEVNEHPGFKVSTFF